jgi:UTP--glucose-1-phosphate uridylyltransferase
MDVIPLHKAVIPAAGLGTRMLPAAKVVPKELLPIVDRPTIQYVVEECAGAGIDDALLITSRSKRAVEDHFERDAELEQRLAAGNRAQLLASIADLAARVKVHSVSQPEQRGLGDAVHQARRHIGNDPFVCLLGDTIFRGDPSPAQQLASVYRRLGTALIGLEEVPIERVERYGIVGGTMIEPGIIRIQTLVEKPARDAAPSRFAIAARYVLTPAIFECLDQTRPGKGGEIQLTDAMRLLLDREPIHGVVLSARRHDIGNPVDWLKTNLVYARHDRALWEELAPLLRELMSDERALADEPRVNNGG